MNAALPSSRSEAKSVRSPRFFTGVPCVHGHVSERLTSSGNCIACSLEKKRDYRRRCSQVVNASNRRYRAENLEQVRARDKARRLAHPSQFAKTKAAYLKRHPAGHCAREAARRAAKLKQTPGWADLKAIKNVYSEAIRLSRVTGIPHDVDHIVPLRGRFVSGLHVEYNLQPLPFRANRQKGNRA